VIYGICGQFFLLHLILVHFMDHLSRPVTVCSAAVILGLDRHSSLSATRVTHDSPQRFPRRKNSYCAKHSSCRPTRPW